MKKTAGFTLIELVIVIVILGILGAVAAPKFLDLRGDAYSANVKSLAGSLQSATTLAVTQASLKGLTTGTKKVEGYGDVEFVNGYPSAHGVDTTKDKKLGILGALQSVPSTNDYNIDMYTAGKITLTPNGYSGTATDCQVTYTQADGTDAAKVEFTASCD